MARRKKSLSRSKRGTRSAEQVITGEGRQYHVGVGPGDIAPYVLLCGDPARARKVADRFDAVRCERANREYITFTGRYRGLDVTVMGTGIGPDNVEIAVVELCQVAEAPTLIRIGSCGALRPGVAIGDLVVSTGAVRLENTSTFFVPEGYPAIGDYEVVLALVSACHQAGFRTHVGLTATAPGFYGAQSRKAPGFPPRFEDLPDRLGRIGVVNMEMEVSALFTLAQVRGIRAGAVCAVFADRTHNRFADEAQKRRGEETAIRAGLGAVTALARMDEWKRRNGKRHWHI